MPNQEELSKLIDTLSPEELHIHSELSSVYRAASEVAISSYNGRIATSPINDLTVEHEELVHRLLNRFSDARGFIEFPIMHQGRVVEELVVSASGVAAYTLRHRKNPQTQKDTPYFSSFPTKKG